MRVSPVILILVLFFFGVVKAQGIDQRIRLQEKTTKKMLFTANKGDIINLDIRRISGKKITSLSIRSYKGPTILEVQNFKKYKQSLRSPDKDIYQIILENDTSEPAIFNLLLDVDSKGKEVPVLAYKVHRDTLYAYPVTQFRKHTEDRIKKVQQEQFYLNSRSNTYIKGGKNRVIFPVNLPENTVAWYYVFTASRNDEDVQNTIQSFNLASTLAKFTEKGKTLSQSITNLSPPPGAHICDLYLLNEKNAEAFRKKEDFIPFSFGSRENFKSGLVRITRMGRGPMYLGINNPNNLYGIHVGIEIVAIVQAEEDIEEIVNIPVITSYRVPYLTH